MSTLGNQPSFGDHVMLDTIVTDGSTAYTLQVNSSSVTQYKAEQLLVSVNGTMQRAGSLLALECMLKQMRRRHLYTFVDVRTPAERETAWKKAERCQAGLYLLTSDEKYNTIEQYA